jgi:inner membrane protein involved in colicin E2 resistance
MNTFASPQPSVPSLRSRSVGGKFFLILLLAIGMSLSGFFIDALTSDRTQAQGLSSAVSSDDVSVQPKTVMGIRLVDSYRSTYRSLHYIPLFLGLVFLTYFLFEVLTGKSVHPAQYALVGVAQIIFYLLLLSLAEHLGFDMSFLVAGTSTVALFTINTKWVFGSQKLALRSLAAFTSVYAFIYVLLRVEAYALLVGAVVSFFAIAVAMFITRNVDWYGNGGEAAQVVTSSSGPRSNESWLR